MGSGLGEKTILVPTLCISCETLSNLLDLSELNIPFYVMKRFYRSLKDLRKPYM